MALADVTRIFPVETVPHLLLGHTAEQGPGVDELVAQPIRKDQCSNGLLMTDPRAAARKQTEKLLADALTRCLGKYHRTLTARANVKSLRDPTPLEIEAARARIAQDAGMAGAFQYVATLRGSLKWLDELDERDGVSTRPAPFTNTYRGRDAMNWF